MLRVIPGGPPAPGRETRHRASRPAPAGHPPAAAELGLLTTAPILAMAAILLLTLIAPALAARAALPLAVVGVVIGIPHGAVDHLLPRWAELTATRAATVALIGAYLSVATLAALALVLAPTIAVLSFLLLSALHFGTAETAFATERRGEPTPRPWHRPLASATHGAVVVGLLLWARPAEVDPWLRLLAPGAADAAGAARPVGLAITAALILGQVLASSARLVIERRSPVERRSEAVLMGELVTLVAVFTVVPPLAAFGVYFGCWHAVRHTGRLLDIARAPADRNWRGAGRRLATASVAPSVIALGTVAGLVMARDHAPIVVEVAVLLALTYPHTGVVWSVDVHRR